MAVLDEDGLTALPGPLAHRLAGLDGLVLEVNGADGRVHSTEEEEQIRAAVGSTVGMFVTKSSGGWFGRVALGQVSISESRVGYSVSGPTARCGNGGSS